MAFSFQLGEELNHLYNPKTSDIDLEVTIPFFEKEIRCRLYENENDDDDKEWRRRHENDQD